MRDVPHHHGRPPTVARRTFLADLGRVTLAAVVLGPALAGCADNSDEDQAGGGTAATGGGTDADTDAEASAADAVAWERASFGFVSAYVLIRAGEALLFDTGTGEDVASIDQALSAAGVGWDALGHVIVSHSHGDHAGGIALVAEQAPEAVLYAGRPDLDGFRDRVSTAEEITDGDTVLGLRVVGTPGHTLGHVSAYDEGTGLLLAGDAIVRDREIGGTTGEGIEASPPDFTADTEQALASVGVLADLRPATILFGHGEPLTDDAATQLSDYAATL